MKTIQKLFLLLSISILLISPIYAGTVPTLNNFTKGTPAVSADVNGNFNDIKTAVDDNDLRITTLEKSTPGAGDLSVQLSGTLSVISNTNSVVGGLSGANQTFFTKELKVNTVISIDGQVNVVTSIIDDNNLTIKDPQNSVVDNLPAFTDGDLLTLRDSVGQAKLKVDNTGALLFRNQALPITPVKMAFSRVDTAAVSTVSFKDANGIEASASITNFNFVGNDLIQLEYVLLSSTDTLDVVMSTLYFNISSSPSQSCTLLHNGANSFGRYLITTGYTGSSSLTPGWEKTFKVNLTYSTTSGNSRFGIAFPIPVGKYEIICF